MSHSEMFALGNLGSMNIKEVAARARHRPQLFRVLSIKANWCGRLLRRRCSVPSIVAITDYDSERMSGYVRRMIERKVDGVAIMTSEIDRHRQCMVMAATAPTRI
jgi:hypothetical protein